MTIGPVQLLVLGFRHADLRGGIVEELERLRRSGAVRVIDALAVYKDAAGAIEVEDLSTLTTEEAVELGSRVGALVGLAIEGEPGMVAGRSLDDAGAWDVIGEIPRDSAAALILIEHHWAVPLRDAVVRAGGFRAADGFVGPDDLLEVGLLNAEEARAWHDLGGAATRVARRTRRR
ncbi:hypothetical protein, partial [Paractinoplanes deccanensis]